MGAKTGIQWTDATWNPVAGCSPQSPGCTNCYAQRQCGTRLSSHPLYANTTTPSKAGPVFNGTMTRAEPGHPVWTWPLRWRGSKEPKMGPGKPSTIFVCDMSDLFHENRPDEDIDDVIGTIGRCEEQHPHIFQILTKNAERMHGYMTTRAKAAWNSRRLGSDAWPARNIWLGVSAEDQQRADQRIPHLLATPAVMRFVSAEPLLGPVDLRDYLVGHEEPGLVGNCVGWTPPIDWLIDGGESGPHAREYHIEWSRSIEKQCRDAGTAYFRKQIGPWPSAAERTDFFEWAAVDELGDPNRRYSAMMKDSHGGDWNEWPADLRVREFPAP